MRGIFEAINVEVENRSSRCLFV